MGTGWDWDEDWVGLGWDVSSSRTLNSLEVMAKSSSSSAPREELVLEEELGLEDWATGMGPSVQVRGILLELVILD